MKQRETIKVQTSSYYPNNKNFNLMNELISKVKLYNK